MCVPKCIWITHGWSFKIWIIPRHVMNHQSPSTLSHKKTRSCPPSPLSSKLCSLLSIEWLKEFKYIVQSLWTYAFPMSILMYTEYPPLKYRCPIKINNLKQAMLTLSADPWKNNDLLLYIEMPWTIRMPNLSLVLSRLSFVCSLYRVGWYHRSGASQRVAKFSSSGPRWLRMFFCNEINVCFIRREMIVRI